MNGKMTAEHSYYERQYGELFSASSHLTISQARPKAVLANSLVTLLISNEQLS
jgi:hypothetical protein